MSEEDKYIDLYEKGNPLKIGQFKDFNKIPSIYHYTSVDALRNIISNNRLRASDFRFLNDSQEMYYTSKLINNIYEDKFKNNMYIKKLIDRYLIELKNINNFYILSTSFNSDNATLWYNYAKNEGYNIEFNLNKLVDIFENTSNYKYGIIQTDTNTPIGGMILYDEVNYDIISQTNLIISILNYYNNLINSATNEIMFYTYETLTIQKLLICSAFFKHNYFKSESEFRILINIHSGLNNCINFRTANGVIIPYIEIGFEYNSRNSLPVNTISIGPKNNSEIAEIGLKIFLDKNNYTTVNIIKSDGPLRF